MADQQRPAAGLYNDPLLSDIKIKQVSKDGQVREYYAHKLILSADSRYFYKAFTGHFREASEAVMTLHDDDAEHFEFFLKFMYTHHYDTDAIVKLAAGDKNRRVSIPSEIHAVADKYDMPLLLEPIAKDVEELLAGEVPCTLDLIKTLIPAYYKAVSSVGSPLGEIFASKIKTKFDPFCDSVQFSGLVKAYPVFGADMTFFQVANTFQWNCTNCRHLNYTNLARLRKDKRSYCLCDGCGDHRTIESLGSK